MPYILFSIRSLKIKVPHHCFLSRTHVLPIPTYRTMPRFVPPPGNRNTSGPASSPELWPSEMRSVHRAPSPPRSDASVDETWVTNKSDVRMSGMASLLPPTNAAEELRRQNRSAFRAEYMWTGESAIIAFTVYLHNK